VVLTEPESRLTVIPYHWRKQTWVLNRNKKINTYMIKIDIPVEIIQCEDCCFTLQSKDMRKRKVRSYVNLEFRV